MGRSDEMNQVQKVIMATSFACAGFRKVRALVPRLFLLNMRSESPKSTTWYIFKLRVFVDGVFDLI